MAPQDLTPLYLLIFAHVVADYPLQPRQLSLKKQEKLVYVLVHALIYLFITLLFLSPFLTYKLTVGVFLLFLSHLFNDSVRVKLSNRWEEKEFIWGVMDQGFHLFAIGVIWCFFSPPGVGYRWLPPLDFKLANKIILYLIGYILVLKGGTDFVRGILGLSPKRIRDRFLTRKGVSIGGLMGNVERVVYLTLFLLGQFVALGFVFLVKVLVEVRFLRDRDQARYFLVGALSSLLIALVIGAVLKFLAGGYN